MLIINLIGVVILFMKTDLVVQIGIRSYKTVEIVIRVFQAISILAFFIFLLTSVLKHKKEMQKEKQEEELRAKEEAEYEEQKRIYESPLSTSGRLDSVYIQDMVKNNKKKCPDELSSLVLGMLQNMQDMDKLQEKLKRLLKNNGYEALSNTVEIIDKVEQYICQNVRKVLNYYDVLDWNKSRAALKEKTKECIEDNQEQLQKSEEFILAMTDFLNSQGNRDADVEALESYKQVILSSIKN